jgi:hypothetical protein
MIRHIVVFKIADEHRGELAGLVEAIDALRGQIDEIRALACGPLLNDSEYHCALTVDVADDVALEAYRSHPAHVPVLESLRAISTGIVVADIAL